jgi:hypothetical protein
MPCDLIYMARYMVTGLQAASLILPFSWCVSWCVELVFRLISGRESGYYHFTDLEDTWAEVSQHPKLQLRIVQFLSKLFTGFNFTPSPELIQV